MALQISLGGAQLPFLRSSVSSLTRQNCAGKISTGELSQTASTNSSERFSERQNSRISSSSSSSEMTDKAGRDEVTAFVIPAGPEAIING